MNSSTEDSTSIQQINTSIQKLYDFLFESGFRSAKKASKDDLIDKIIYFEEFIHNHSNNLCAFGDQLLACFCLLLVPTMDSEIRSIVWDVVIQIIAYCIAFDINLIQWKQLFNTAFACFNERKNRGHVQTVHGDDTGY